MSDVDSPVPAIVFNPTKIDDEESLRLKFAGECARRGWNEPMWFETTERDNGTGQARLAVQQGADVVIAMGGDGTVRSVAAALQGTGVPLGIIPMGTGNLLAQNVGIPCDDQLQALRTALTGDDRSVDTVHVNYVDEKGVHKDELSLVMAGIGFDAEIMAETSDTLKKAVGPLAYVVAGLGRIMGVRHKVSLSVDEQPARPRRVRSLIVGNCGQIGGGVDLIPDAQVDDGKLDVVVLKPSGLFGWVAAAIQVAQRNTDNSKHLARITGQSVTLRSAKPVAAQIDGDAIGDIVEMTCTTERHALCVRIPTPDPVDSIRDARASELAAARTESGKIDLRGFDSPMR